jgi:hypothetical protein
MIKDIRFGQTGFWEKTKQRRELPQEHFHSFCQSVRELIGSVNTSAFFRTLLILSKSSSMTQ